jgi:hypothetical protein
MNQSTVNFTFRFRDSIFLIQLFLLLIIVQVANFQLQQSKKEKVTSHLPNFRKPIKKFWLVRQAPRKIDKNNIYVLDLNHGFKLQSRTAIVSDNVKASEASATISAIFVRNFNHDITTTSATTI